MTPTAIASAALLLAGCASFSPDGGAGRVSELTQERTGQAVGMQRSASDVDSARARASELLKPPLTAESAVELALLN
ncbi:MAG TPA: RND transporter, partial [Roseateles sp.]|nr:RND transporter [Roseateles sp.]